MTHAVPPVEDSTVSSVDTDPPLPPALAVVSVVVFTAVSVLCAVIEVTLVPLRHGATVVPLTVPLAVLSNIAVPTLSRRAVPLTIAALFPAVAWILTVILLSQARPEGDLLLIGTKPLVDVAYALLGLGLVSGLGTVIRGQHVALAHQRGPQPSGSQPSGPQSSRSQPSGPQPSGRSAAGSTPSEPTGTAVSSGRTAPRKGRSTRR